MKKLILTIVSLLLLTFCYSQSVIKMEKKNGVYYVPCAVNGLNLKFILDTGAGDVTISLAEAAFMIKNGYMKESDLIGTEYYRIANGEITEGTKIIIRELKVGNRILTNVEASIVHTLSAPLLLGQSAIERFGKFSIDYSTNSLILDTVSGSQKQSNDNKSVNTRTKSTGGKPSASSITDRVSVLLENGWHSDKPIKLENSEATTLMGFTLTLLKPEDGIRLNQWNSEGVMYDHKENDAMVYPSSFDYIIGEKSLKMKITFSAGGLDEGKEYELVLEVINQNNIRLEYESQQAIYVNDKR